MTRLQLARFNTVMQLHLAVFLLALSLKALPSFIPLVILLSVIRTYIATVSLDIRVVLSLWFTLTSAISATHLMASIHALSTPGMSVISLIVLSALSSGVALAFILLDRQIIIHLNDPWAKLTVFPAIWATLWSAIAYFSPLGRLITWTPIYGTGSYAWANQVLGTIGTDWIVATWAVVGTHLIERSLANDSADEGVLIQHELPADARDHLPRSSASPKILLLTAFLVAMTLPSFVIDDLPLSPFSTDATPLTVGCVLPRGRSQEYTPTLDDFIAESKKMTSAKVLLWPEGAVKFNSLAEKEEALTRVRQEVRGPYIGVTFEDFAPSDSRNGNGRSGIRRMGLSIVSNDSEATLLSYYKRHVVPIAESFSLTPSTDPPTIYTLQLSHPSGTRKTDWAPGPNFTRPIPLTASICLDFAQPSPFSALDSRPSLILAPARTWHISVGMAMWEQARLRADEIGSMVLWCDGGEGGVSGIGGGGMHDVTQVGPGSWMRTIGVQWPFNRRRTIYATSGDIAGLLLCWIVVFVGSLRQLTIDSIAVGHTGRFMDAFRRLREMIRGWRGVRGVNPGEGQPLLL